MAHIPINHYKTLGVLSEKEHPMGQNWFNFLESQKNQLIAKAKKENRGNPDKIDELKSTYQEAVFTLTNDEQRRKHDLANSMNLNINEWNKKNNDEEENSAYKKGVRTAAIMNGIGKISEEKTARRIDDNAVKPKLVKSEYSFRNTRRKQYWNMASQTGTGIENAVSSIYKEGKNIVEDIYNEGKKGLKSIQKQYKKESTSKLHPRNWKYFKITEQTKETPYQNETNTNQNEPTNITEIEPIREREKMTEKEKNPFKRMEAIQEENRRTSSWYTSKNRDEERKNVSQEVSQAIREKQKKREKEKEEKASLENRINTKGHAITAAGGVLGAITGYFLGGEVVGPIIDYVANSFSDAGTYVIPKVASTGIEIIALATGYSLLAKEGLKAYWNKEIKEKKLDTDFNYKTK